MDQADNPTGSITDAELLAVLRGSDPQNAITHSGLNEKVRAAASAVTACLESLYKRKFINRVNIFKQGAWEFSYWLTGAVFRSPPTRFYAPAGDPVEPVCYPAPVDPVDPVYSTEPVMQDDRKYEKEPVVRKNPETGTTVTAKQIVEYLLEHSNPIPYSTLAAILAKNSGGDEGKVRDMMQYLKRIGVILFSREDGMRVRILGNADWFVKNGLTPPDGLGDTAETNHDKPVGDDKPIEDAKRVVVTRSVPHTETGNTARMKNKSATRPTPKKISRLQTDIGDMRVKVSAHSSVIPDAEDAPAEQPTQNEVTTMSNHEQTQDVDKTPPNTDKKIRFAYTSEGTLLLLGLPEGVVELTKEQSHALAGFVIEVMGEPSKK